MQGPAACIQRLRPTDIKLRRDSLVIDILGVLYFGPEKIFLALLLTQRGYRRSCAQVGQNMEGIAVSVSFPARH